MANVTLDSEFYSLGSIWQETYPWSLNGFTFGDSTWLGNPTLLPPDADPIAFNDNGVVTLSDLPRPADVAADAVGGKSRIGGLLTTQGTFSQTYGYFEASIQMPAGKGIMGAFWLDTPSGIAPQLDVAEMVGGSPTTLVNTAWPSATPQSNWVDVPNMTWGFHTYAVDWEPDYITWYFDGKQTYQIATPASMDKPMFLVANLTSGTSGTWEGTPSASHVAKMQVADVRVYDSNPYTGDGTLTYQSSNSSAASSSTPQAAGSSGTAGNATAANDPPAAAASNATAVSDPPAAAASSVTNDTVAPINTVTVGSGSQRLTATPAADEFVLDGTGHHTIIRDFTPGIDKLDFEQTGQVAGSASITSSRNGYAKVSFAGNHVVLPHVTADQLSQSDILINGQSSS